MFGGGGATSAPADIEIRRNYLFKPLPWLLGTASYDGGAMVSQEHSSQSVKNFAELKHAIRALLEHKGGGPTGRYPLMAKNLFELKNAARVLLEGNVLENIWGGFSQSGSAILLTPKNQNGLCPACLVSDVDIRYNMIHKAGRAFEIGNVPDDAPPGAPIGPWSSGGHKL